MGHLTPTSEARTRAVQSTTELNPLMASQLHYLTVQDVLWINLQVTGKAQHFSYSKLEEATYYQYAYGESKSVVKQAAKFLTGFPKMSPLDAGNDATIFIACLTFLEINGFSIELKDGKAGEWFESVVSKKTDAETAINSIAKLASGHHGPADVRTTIKDLLTEFPCTLLALTKE
jgi:prophage maintenance system killer protein